MINVTKDIYVYAHQYSQFQKTLPRSSLQMHWISLRFYEMGDSWIPCQSKILFFVRKIHKKNAERPEIVTIICFLSVNQIMYIEGAGGG